MKLLLKIAYDGRNYCGWQVQKNGTSIQGELCRAASEVYHETVKVTGCSRTDSGVSAKEYFCTLELSENAPSVPLDRLPTALNVKLNEDITVYSATSVSDDFHARYSVESKTYEYVIDNGEQRDPFLKGRAWYLKKPLDEQKMDRAAKAFIGRKDFAAFMASGSSVTDTVRCVKYAEVVREGRNVIFRVSADGFLYNMVRIMVGTLTDVSAGKIQENEIEEIIESKDRGRAGMTAPPDGLYLCQVVYRD